MTQLLSATTLWLTPTGTFTLLINCPCGRTNIIVVVDEAHRTQYGFQAKTVDEKDDQGEIIGKKVVYGFAKYLRDVLPKATYLGFTRKTNEEIETTIRQVIDKALVPEQVIDVFDAAGIKKPDISILQRSFCSN